MEFSDIGEHCSDPTCKQQDYLPFKCDICNKYYCLNHKNHGCEDKNNNVVIEKKKFNLPVCSQKRCKKYILIDNICGQCHKNYCIKHRFHDCEEKKIDNQKKKKDSKKRNRFYKIFNLF